MRAPALWRACHPGPVAAVTGAAALYAASLGSRPAETLGVAAAVLSGQLAIGWQNDLLDVERDRASRRSDKPAALGEVSSARLARAALGSAASCVPLSLRLGRGAGAAHLLAVTSAATYNLGLRATPASALPYVVSFGLLPVAVELAGPAAQAAPPRWWAAGAGALLGVGAHVANVLPDLEDDRANGVAGLPHRLGRSGSLGVMASSLLAAAALLAGFAPGPDRLRRELFSVSAALAAAALVSGRHAGPSRRTFRLVLGIAVADVVLLLAAARASRRGEGAAARRPGR